MQKNPEMNPTHLTERIPIAKQGPSTTRHGLFTTKQGSSTIKQGPFTAKQRSSAIKKGSSTEKVIMSKLLKFENRNTVNDSYQFIIVQEEEELSIESSTSAGGEITKPSGSYIDNQKHLKLTSEVYNAYKVIIFVILKFEKNY